MRVLGRRWWSVLPMHLQYFTPVSLGRVLAAHGFEIAWRGTHAKSFSIRYYAERLGGYHAALERFAAIEPIKAELVKLRYFAGLSLDEAAAALNISPATAKRYWAVARAWLFAALSESEEELER